MVVKPRDNNTPNLFPELFPMGGALDKTNRWFELADLVPWEELDGIYRKYFSENSGRPAKDSRLMCGLLVVKWVEGYSDDRTVQEFQENPYIQMFCGFEHFITQEQPVESSLLSKLRKRLGDEFYDTFEREVLSAVLKKDVLRPRMKIAPRKHRGFWQKVKEFFGIS
jgi:hypothetical protein